MCKVLVSLVELERKRKVLNEVAVALLYQGKSLSTEKLLVKNAEFAVLAEGLLQTKWRFYSGIREDVYKENS